MCVQVVSLHYHGIRLTEMMQTPKEFEDELDAKLPVVWFGDILMEQNFNILFKVFSYFNYYKNTTFF